MTTSRDEREWRTEVSRQLGASYDLFNPFGALDTLDRAEDPQSALQSAKWLLKQALPLAARYADALVQLELELASPDTVEDEYRAGLDAALKIVRGTS